MENLTMYNVQSKSIDLFICYMIQIWKVFLNRAKIRKDNISKKPSETKAS